MKVMLCKILSCRCIAVRDTTQAQNRTRCSETQQRFSSEAEPSMIVQQPRRNMLKRGRKSLKPIITIIMIIMIVVMKVVVMMMIMRIRMRMIMTRMMMIVMMIMTIMMMIVMMIMTIIPLACQQ